jgi:hypothetical protein
MAKPFQRMKVVECAAVSRDMSDDIREDERQMNESL